MTILRKVRDDIRHDGLVSAGDTVVVGVSGGADSVALLSLLYQLRHELGISLHVAHFNHCLRPTARRDETFVKRLAERWHLPCTTGSWQRGRSTSKGSLEERARQRRFKFFEKVAKRTGAQAVALGHTRDDLAETVLMRIVRGTGLQGLRGILPHREIGAITVIRPMLGLAKKDILVYLKKNKLSFVEDPTNKQTKFFRNRIRRELLPLLQKKYNAGIGEMLCNLADHAAADYEYLAARAEAVFKTTARSVRGGNAVRLNAPELLRQPLAIRRLVLRIALERVQGTTQGLTLTHLKALEELLASGPDGGIVHLPHQIDAGKGKDFLRFSRRNA